MLPYRTLKLQLLSQDTRKKVQIKVSVVSTVNMNKNVHILNHISLTGKECDNEVESNDFVRNELSHFLERDNRGQRFALSREIYFVLMNQNTPIVIPCM